MLPVSLIAGSKLGPYEILAPLGAGGMGEVYRARDPRLGREVAIKVLPAERMLDESRRRRFVQEARAASALNHPNIVTIHEIDSADGIDFIVMEYLAGRTLDLRIPRQGLPIAEILRLAIPMADALARAHAAGIIHRDLKPANIAVTPDGTVKLLDFGLAKLCGPEEPVESIEATAATATADLESRPGMVAGTPGYMSPEQAAGRSVDGRSDVFAFGAVLYEMVTGRRAFSGKSAAEARAAVLTEQPKLPSDLGRALPRDLERLIQRCLRKEPERRYQHMLDVKVELLEIKEESDSGTGSGLGRRTTRRGWAAAGVAGLLVAAAIGFTLWRPRSLPPPPPRVETLTALGGVETGPTFSPDGQQVAFAWEGEKSENLDIYVKLLGSSELHRLTTDTAPEGSPSWSPDGRQIAFGRWSAGTASIRLISPLGGSVRRLSDEPWNPPLSWSPDGRSLVAQRPHSESAPDKSGGLWRISLEGGEAQRLTSPPEGGEDKAPAFSPDGRRLAYARCVTPEPPTPCDVYVVDLDPQLAPKASPRRLTRQAFNIFQLAWSPDGASIVYDTESGPYTFFLWRVDLEGNRPPVRLEVAGIGARAPAVSASGHRLAYARDLIDFEIARFAAGRPSQAFLQSSSYDGLSRFSPDGRRVAFESTRSGERLEVWLAVADGSGPSQLTRGPRRWQGSPAWSPDGLRIAFDSQGEDGHWDIFTIDVEGGAPRRMTHDPGDENVPSWSRDGRWIYFGSRRDGTQAIWRVPTAGGAEERVSRNEAWFEATETVDARALVFKRGSGRAPLVAQPLAGGPDKRLVACDAGYPRGFTLVAAALYYTPCGDGHGDVAALHRLDLGSGQDRRLGVLEGYAGSLSVSPDERTILYQRFVRRTSDLMLIENFR